MNYARLKSHAKINLALNVIGKNSSLHIIESIIVLIDLYDEIMIKKIKSKNHIISFNGKFSKNINKQNSISKLLEILEKKKLLNNKKFKIKINKRIPNKAGLGGGSMNAASVLKYFAKKKIINTNRHNLESICRLIGSDVVLGLNSNHSILYSRNKIKYFSKIKRFYVLIVKPNFGCSTKYIYSKVKKIQKAKLKKPTKRMFNFDYLKKMNNSLELIAISKYYKLRSIKLFLENLSKTVFVRMTGSGSAFVAYFQSKEECDNAKKEFNKKHKNYWCISSKTI